VIQYVSNAVEAMSWAGVPFVAAAPPVVTDVP
jgi:hypothetical protein